MHDVNLHGKFTLVYTRSLKLPNYSFFLFGPRGTGKTTWLRKNLSSAYWKNLLLDSDYLPLLNDSSILSKEVEALKDGSWIVIDEVQKIPNLLNEVHNLISLHGSKYKFALSGSSARKLKRLNSNLLAGRAIEKKMFPLTYDELGLDFNLEQILTYGSIPAIYKNLEIAQEILSTYVGTYLKQEIQQEALVKDIGSFHRFLKVVGIYNSEIINISNMSRECAVNRNTAERYLDIMIDTLIGFRLPGWQAKLKVREQLSPKFYLFDTGVARALTNRIYQPLGDLETGSLLETYILHELRSHLSYHSPGSELYYYRTAAGLEVDFIIVNGEEVIALEVKSSKNWKSSFEKGLKELIKGKKKIKCYGIYCGDKKLKSGEIMIYPVKEFLSTVLKTL